MYSSDIEQSGANYASDKNNSTTDEEFFNELMEVPPEFEDHLISDDCKDEVKGLEHLIKCLDFRFNAYPAVFMGTFKQAVQESFGSKEINDRRPCLLYVNNDKSVYSNLFCKQLLCNEKIIDYLMNNYVLWAWDVTFKSNEQMLNHICQTIFPSWNHNKQFDSNSVDEYPLLIGIYRDINGNFSFDRLIEGSIKQRNLDEFLASLVEFKDKFILSERQFEKAKEEAKRQMLESLFQARHILNRSKHAHEREYTRSMSMYAHAGYDEKSSRQHVQFRRLLSSGMDARTDPAEIFFNNPPTKEELMHVFDQFRTDSDDADDEDDERTPTVDRPAPKFP